MPTMAGRTIAIGDIHGCAAALRALIEAIAPAADDTIVALGDFVDRGPDSRGVIEQVIALASRCRLVPLMGNHEELLLDALRNPAAIEKWLRCGGTETVRSYGGKPDDPSPPIASLIPRSHQEFIASCRPYFETDTHLFVHAGVVAELPIDQQPGLAMRWRVTHRSTAQPHCSGKTLVVGHTPQSSGEVLDLGFLLCLDTHCYRGGFLTALELPSGQLWQAGRQGRMRTGELRRER
jgi:serine/threonine protein phosphatase 1